MTDNFPLESPVKVKYERQSHVSQWADPCQYKEEDVGNFFRRHFWATDKMILHMDEDGNCQIIQAYEDENGNIRRERVE